MPRPEELAYVAGLVDGEGSISASPSRRCPKNVRVILAITMCDREGLDFTASVMGGRVRLEKSKTKTGKPIYSWALYCRKAGAALEALLPYLRIKNGKAKDAIALALLSQPRNVAKMHKFTSNEIEERMLLCNKIRAANRATNGRLQNAVT